MDFIQNKRKLHKNLKINKYHHEQMWTLLTKNNKNFTILSSKINK